MTIVRTDSPHRIVKHASHDQSSHGNWARMLPQHADLNMKRKAILNSRWDMEGTIADIPSTWLEENLANTDAIHQARGTDPSVGYWPEARLPDTVSEFGNRRMGPFRS